MQEGQEPCLLPASGPGGMQGLAEKAVCSESPSWWNRCHAAVRLCPWAPDGNHGGEDGLSTAVMVGALKQAGSWRVSTEVLKVTLETGGCGASAWMETGGVVQLLCGVSLSLSHRYVERCCSHRGVVCGGGWSLNVDLLTSGPEQGMRWQWSSPGVGQVWKNPSKIQKYSLSSTGSGCSERFSLFRWNSNRLAAPHIFDTAPIWQQTLSGGRRIAWSSPRTTNVLLLWTNTSSLA